MNIKKFLAITMISILLVLSSCTAFNASSQLPANSLASANTELPSQAADESSSGEPSGLSGIVKPFDDIRFISFMNQDATYEVGRYDSKDIITYTFNEGTVLKGSEDIQKQVMENGKNPGLGIRKLHEEGITGKGINVAIIDQNLLLHHPEFDGKIVQYHDTGCDTKVDSGSMHAPAVTSILVGNSIGVAPDTKVYFAAAPSWKQDSKFYADALYWIIEENKKLPEGEKIRVVSVSAAPSGKGTVFTENQEMWDQALTGAQNDGILVLDCRIGNTTGIIGPAYYDPSQPDNIELCKPGWPSIATDQKSDLIGVPCSYRTVAEEYFRDTPSYQYTGQGGLSWAIPYAAGVLALGWQVNPKLSSEQIVDLLFESCFITKDGFKIINPTEFITKIKEQG